MGQAKQRGTFEQRRQAAIAKAMPAASPSTLNEAYKAPPRPHARVGTFGRGNMMLMSAALLSLSGWQAVP